MFFLSFSVYVCVFKLYASWFLQHGFDLSLLLISICSVLFFFCYISFFVFTSVFSEIYAL